MSSDPSALDPKLKAKMEALFDSKIKQSGDGTCVVSIKAMQYIVDELRSLTAGLEDLKDTSKKMLFQQTYTAERKAKSPDVAKMAANLPNLSRKLRDLHLTLQMSLPMAGYEEHEHLTVRIPPYQVEIPDFSIWDLPRAGLVNPGWGPWSPCSAMTEEERARQEKGTQDAAPVVAEASVASVATAPVETYTLEDLYA